MKIYQYYLVLLDNKKAEQAMAEDLTKEIYEDFGVATQVLSDFFFSCKSLLHVTSQITHLDHPDIRTATKDFVSLAKHKTHQQTVDLIRDWMALDDPEKHLALSGISYTGIKKALYPKKLLLCPVAIDVSFVDSPNILSKVVIDNGWVKEIDSGESCPLLGCVPLGNGYVAWRLYPEDTFVPILGFIDFCRNMKCLPLVKEWFTKNSENPIGRALGAIYQIEEIEIIRGALFI